MKIIWRLAKGLALLLLLAIVAIPALIYFDSNREIDTSGEYVALGSSYAASPELGERISGSPNVCMRFDGGYPQILARQIGLKLVNNSCSGATAKQMVDGGQWFLAPQIDAVGPDARLVTITAGGNDVDFIGDMMKIAGGDGWLAGLRGKGIAPFEQRPFDQSRRSLVRLVEAVRNRAPGAIIMLVNYPTVLPGQGTCDALGLTEEQANLFRRIETRLQAITAQAAEETGAVLVDAAALSRDHDICSEGRWIAGVDSSALGVFHPTAAGARGVADAITQAYRRIEADRPSQEPDVNSR